MIRLLDEWRARRLWHRLARECEADADLFARRAGACLRGGNEEAWELLCSIARDLRKAAAFIQPRTPTSPQ